MRKFFHLVTASLIASMLISSTAFAQEDEEEVLDVDQIEAEIGKGAQKQIPNEEPPASSPADEKLENFSGLGRLAPFSEVSVLQRRFQPKSGRFQFFAGLSNIVNDPWFMGIGADLKFGYHFTEAWSVELDALGLSSSERQTIKDLFVEHGVQASSIITTKGYYGVHLNWTPIYGKMGMFDDRIIPFDMYFSAGGGSTQVENGTGGTTLHLGTGQIFAISKGMGFRWDFTWNAFTATPNTAPGGVPQSAQSFNNLMLTLGLSFFFPEVSYR